MNELCEEESMSINMNRNNNVIMLRSPETRIALGGKARRDCHNETKRQQTCPTNETWARIKLAELREELDRKSQRWRTQKETESGWTEHSRHHCPRRRGIRTNSGASRQSKLRTERTTMRVWTPASEPAESSMGRRAGASMDDLMRAASDRP